ncbi:hypothetical protein FRC04_006677 [Tulasnella sp. 424]|nr:hypothetical protein FRC04_006677 [Tulasnella sp. 424]
MTYTSDEYDENDDVRELNSIPLPPTGSNSSRSNGERLIRRRSSKACDGCRKAKCKCERTPEAISNGDPCRSCVLLGQGACVCPLSPPKGYIDALESKLHQMEALLDTIINPLEVRPQLRRALNTICNPVHGLSPQMQHLVEPGVADKTINPPGLLLRPTLPSLLPRYDRPVSGWCGSLRDVVPPNTRPSNTTKCSQLPDGWEEYTSPEGDTYFRHQKLSIVTNTNIRLPSYEQVFIMAHDRLMELGGAIDLHIRDSEVFIQVTEKTPFTYQAEYYFVDHHVRLPFWVHPVRVQDLGLPSFGTNGHLRAALTPEFWTHMEYFPAHQALDTSSESELIAIFRHGCADDITSYGSTFPYDARDCRNFLQTLEGFVASGEFSSYRTSIFAKLWASITRVRHANGYSLDGPRLDRLQGLEHFTSDQRPDLYIQMLITLSLALPLTKFNRISELWNGPIKFTVPQATAIYSASLLLLALLELAADSLRDSDAISLAMLLAATFGPAIIVYLMLRVDTWNGASDNSEELVDAQEFRWDGSDM